MNIHVHQTVDDLAHAMADRIETAVSTHQAVDIGLAGGSTPRLVHARLAQRPIDWTTVTTWMTDERWVPPGDAESNQRMARETLVDPVGVRFLAPDTTLEDPTIAAAGFERTLREHDVGGERHSIVMLGLGQDGHTASLFPGTSALEASDRLYVDTWVPQLDTWRLTATYDMLAAADRVVFLVTGQSKAEIVASIAKGGEFPASSVIARGEVEWLLDLKAASLL